MEFVCINSTIRMTAFMVRNLQALIWKLGAAKVQSSGREGNIVRTRLYLGKNVVQIWKASFIVVRPDAFVYRPNST